MARRTPRDAEPYHSHWQRRVRSKAFKRSLAAALQGEINALSARSVKDVVDAELVRRTIREWDSSVVNAEVVADLLIRGHRALPRRLKRSRTSLLGLLDKQLVADIEAILKEDLELLPNAEAFIAKLMGQEFVRRLLTDVIFTAIVSFNQRVNPLFGAFTTSILEEQIKRFIRLFMPMLERQAIAFAVDERNQRILLDFTRVIVRQLLDEPLAHYSATAAALQGRALEDLIRDAVGNATLDALIRKAALLTWDDVYATIRNKCVGDVVQLDRHAGWLVERALDVILPALSEAPLVRFIGAEIALAAAGDGARPSRPRVVAAR